MTRISLARQWRPKKLSELIGQPALVQTLTNAITGDRVAPAYLFSGPRGTGKTSTARIIARALNCEHGPTPEPCGTCGQCRQIAEERHLDVVEMDAASQTGVDNMRALIESIPYAPTQGRIKVYILDEVHMLSKNSWNALLKTLEEPPVHTVFIFCTTEPRKVPATVLSRCQRFQLNHVAESELAAHITRIAEAESYAVTKEAVAVVARAAEGGVRDAISLLDQMISALPEGADDLQTRKLFGLPDAARIDAVLEFALERKPAEALRVWREMIELGTDPLIGIQDLMGAVHRASILAAAPAAAVACGITAKETKWPIERLQAAWQQLARSEPDVRESACRTFSADMAILGLSA